MVPGVCGEESWPQFGCARAKWKENLLGCILQLREIEALFQVAWHKIRVKSQWVTDISKEKLIVSCWRGAAKDTLIPRERSFRIEGHPRTRHRSRGVKSKAKGVWKLSGNAREDVPARADRGFE